MLLGPSSGALKIELRERARERDLTLDVVEIAESSGVYNALQQVLPASDFLLALADPTVYNASTVYGLLLTSYRAHVPVIAFSEGLVKAGALVGLFSTARQVGKQGAEIARRVLGNERGAGATISPLFHGSGKSECGTLAGDCHRGRGDAGCAIGRIREGSMNRWGIRARVLFLALMPSIMILLALVGYFTYSRITEVDVLLAQRGISLARQLAPATEFALFAGDRVALERLAGTAAREADVANVTIFDAQGSVVAQGGGLIPRCPGHGPVHAARDRYTN